LRGVGSPATIAVTMSRSRLLGLGVAFALLGLSTTLAAQRWGWGRYPPRFAEPGDLERSTFTFCRIAYDQVRNEELGHGWNTDYPNSDANFMIRLGQLTRVAINELPDGQPNHVVVRATDDEIFSCPFTFMSDVGTTGFSAEERERLGLYLRSGGFLYVDDFWGERAWQHWADQIAGVLPPAEYPVVDLEPGDEIFNSLYHMEGVPQVPSIQHWNWTGGFSTSERGTESEVPHLRGIRDANGRLMVVMSHNTDIADGWEREGEDEEYFARFSVTKSYPMGINIVLYSMTH